MKIKELKKLGNERLKQYNVDDATIKINILLQFVLKMNKTEIMLKDDLEISKKTEDLFFNYVEEIINGKPIQYITNYQEFMGLPFYVDENVLIPQPDTEILVGETINVMKKLISSKITIVEETNSSIIDRSVNERKDNIKVLDICTGSGAIAVSLENYLLKDKEYEEYRYRNLPLKPENNKKIEIYATDISTKALEIAKKNAISNNKNSNIHFILSDMFENIHDTDFDIIVSNPPYIETKTITQLSKEVQNEPHMALDGGEDGLDFYRIIAKEAKKHLKENGHILLEIGYNQKDKVVDILKKENYIGINCKEDLGGNDRVIKCRNWEN